MPVRNAPEMRKADEHMIGPEQFMGGDGVGHDAWITESVKQHRALITDRGRAAGIDCAQAIQLPAHESSLHL